MTGHELHRQAEDANRALWDEMAAVHVRAYKEVQLLRQGSEVLDQIELREIGDVRGKRLLHLQCHIGTDTLGWARHGAAVTGVDFSPRAIACAQELRDELGLEATFIQSNVYDLPSLLSEQFDIVYASRGVLCWLRDLDEWARIIDRFLVPGGVFYLMESHPVVHALEEISPGVLSFANPYFHRAEPVRWEAGDCDYANASHILAHPSYEWTWTIGDVVNALLKAGLELEFLNEYDRLYFQLFPSMTSDDGRWYRLPQYQRMLPLIFTLRARKPG
ncbi:MAG: class I SAM-dependent methyltransferase [Dehalococcoidia bacterium]|nr:class I SAM-dependent methyltransferase [Dehalococcoidia bacterium]